MMRKKWIWILTLIWLSGCGWHLRGAQDAGHSVTRIHLSATDPYTTLYRSFREEYEHRGITLVADTKAPQLKLLGETLRSRVVSYNTELDPAEEELTLTVRYLVNGQPQQMEDRKTLEKNKNRAAASESEKKILADQMRRALAEKILQQLTRTPAPSGQAAPSRENLP